MRDETIITDYEGLGAARANLDAMAEALHRAAWDAPAPEGAHMAAVAARCEVAADAIFTALNGAHSYLDDSEAFACMFPDGCPDELVAPTPIGLAA